MIARRMTWERWMPQRRWQETVERMGRLLGGLSMRDARGMELGADEGFARWREWTVTLRRRRRVVYLMGNGASAAMAFWLALRVAMVSALAAVLVTSSAETAAKSSGNSCQLRRRNSAAASAWAAR